MLSNAASGSGAFSHRDAVLTVGTGSLVRETVPIGGSYRTPLI